MARMTARKVKSATFRLSRAIVLSSYIRPMGGKVPSIYSPSADDPGRQTSFPCTVLAAAAGGTDFFPTSEKLLTNTLGHTIFFLTIHLKQD